MAVADAKPSYSRDSLRWQPTTPKAPHVFKLFGWTHLLDALLDDLFDERRWGSICPGKIAWAPRSAWPWPRKIGV